MAKKTITQLRTTAQTIRDETIKRANTASRVGTFLDDFIDSVPDFIDGQWEFCLDNAATVGNKLTITGGTRTQITNNGLNGAIQSNTGNSKLWNTTTNRIEPEFANSFIVVRVALHAESVGGGTNYFDVEFDVSGGTFPVIWEQTGTLIKGAGIDQAFNFNMLLFVGEDFILSGGGIFITPLNDIEIYQIGITVARTYLEIIT